MKLYALYDPRTEKWRSRHHQHSWGPFEELQTFASRENAEAHRRTQIREWTDYAKGCSEPHKAEGYRRVAQWTQVEVRELGLVEI